MKKLDYISNDIQRLKDDIRAEVIINEILENNQINDEQFVIRKEGQFSRAYRFDILNSEITDYNYDSTQILTVSLSRDSIYDILPENIFHKSKSDTPGKDVDIMIREYNEQKKQQKSTRRFFQPFENEFFRYGVKTEKFESNFLSELNASSAPEMFYNFWNISKDFPPLLISKFIRILPFAYKIVGDIPLASKILGILLEEKVVFKYRNHQEYADQSQAISLGSTRLGLDTITGTHYNDYSCHLDIEIGPLEKTPLSDYIHDGSKKKFIDMFFEHFFPIEVEINTNIILQQDKTKFKLKSSQQTVLGYNTSI